MPFLTPTPAPPAGHVVVIETMHIALMEEITLAGHLVTTLARMAEAGMWTAGRTARMPTRRVSTRWPAGMAGLRRSATLMRLPAGMGLRRGATLVGRPAGMFAGAAVMGWRILRQGGLAERDTEADGKKNG